MSSDTLSSTTQTANDRTDGWLSAFDAALTAGDVDAVLQLFGPDCHWRDFVSFTWNLHTAEGSEQNPCDAGRHPRAHRATPGSSSTSVRTAPGCS